MDHICNLVAAGENVTKIGQREDMPAASTIWLAIRSNPEYSETYARARRNRSHVRVDRIDDYKDRMVDGQLDPMVARVAIDTEKWQASKENNEFADSLKVTATVETPAVTKEQMIEMMRKSPSYLAQIEAMVAEAKKPAKPKE